MAASTTANTTAAGTKEGSQFIREDSHPGESPPGMGKMTSAQPSQMYDAPRVTIIDGISCGAG